jgi:predicted  nucleic acid-binding Zn-ribbon protein
VAKLDQEAARLANRILMSTDTNEILRLRAEQQKVQASLDAARSELEASRKALENLQEEARRAGVPPGWVREP